MSNRSLSSLLFTLYNIGLFGAMLAVPLLVFLLSVISNPNQTGRVLLSLAGASAAALVILAVGTRLAMRLFFERACDAAFEEWMSNPRRSQAVTPTDLAHMADLRPQDIWLARQFLTRRAAQAREVRYVVDQDPNLVGYIFPRSADGNSAARR